MSPRVRILRVGQAAAVVLALTVVSWPVSFAEAQRTVSQAPSTIPLTMPNQEGALKFAVLGDFGTGAREQYMMAETIGRVHQQYNFTLALLVGDNLYGSERPQDFAQKFEIPYKPLLDAKVEFRASLGNHDSREQRKYPKFNMNGESYYTFKTGNVRFFVLESTYMDLKQLVWLEKELKASNDDWKIAYFHHALYCSAGRHGSDVQLRDRLEPLFVAYNVSVVFTGHDHVYERTKPQKDITYFVVGSTGKLAPGDLDMRSPVMAKGFDAEQAFLVAEINKDEMSFNTISRSGKLVDSGKLTRRQGKNPPQ